MELGLRQRWNRLKRAGYFPWLVGFLLLNVLVTDSGGMNPLSRFAVMRAMVHDRTFRIDPYVPWTLDWSRTPDGHTYSNKAPGPMLLGFPLMWVMDHSVEAVLRLSQPEQAKDYWSRETPFVLRVLLSILLQALPFALGVGLVLQWMEERGVGQSGLTFAALGMLFGNTAVPYMNLYFGHGMASWLVLFCVLALLSRRPLLAGLSFGFALLSDYGAGLLLLPVLGSLLLTPRDSRRADLRRFVCGGLLPGALWSGYHTACFGSPFVISLKFQNPIFVDGPQASPRLWGILALKPALEGIRGLLWGGRVGLLVTQPWVLLVFAGALVAGLRRRVFEILPPPLALFTLLGFPLLFWFNASFNQWHGGSAVGPRYICMIFPVLAVAGGLLLDQARGGLLRVCLWGSMAFAVGVRSLIYTGPLNFNEGDPLLWRFWKNLGPNPQWRAWISFGVFWMVFLGTAWGAARKRLPKPG